MAGVVARIKARTGPKMMNFDGTVCLCLKRKMPQRRNVATMTRVEVSNWKKTYYNRVWIKVEGDVVGRKQKEGKIEHCRAG